MGGRKTRMQGHGRTRGPASESTVSRLSRSVMEAAAPAARLTVVFPRALAASFVVEGRPFVIGRRGDGQVCHPTVSRAHLAIAWSAEAGGHLARGLGSPKGSALGGGAPGGGAGAA